MVAPRPTAPAAPAPSTPGLADVLPPAPPPRFDLHGPLLALPPPPRPPRSPALARAAGAVAVVGLAAGALVALDGAARALALASAAALALAATVLALRARAGAAARAPAPAAPPLTGRDPEAVVAAAAVAPASAPADVLADLPLLDAPTRAAIARALAGAAAPGPLLAALAADDDPDVRAATVDSLTRLAAAGHPIPPAVAAAVIDRERATVAALLAVRPPAGAPALHAAEVDRALAATLGRLHALALAAPAVRHLVERALATPVARVSRDAIDPWLTALLAGEHAVREPAIAALRACPLFAALPGRHADDLAARADHRHLAPGDVLVQAGDRARALHVVVDGALALADGPAPRALGPGASVGVRALVDDAPGTATATVRATARTELLAIDRATLAAACARWPPLADALASALGAPLTDRSG